MLQLQLSYQASELVSVFPLVCVWKFVIAQCLTSKGSLSLSLSISCGHSLAVGCGVQVMNVMGNWGAGNFSNEKAEETAKACFAEDCVCDATASITSTDMYHVYNGPMGIIEWVKNLDQIEFKDFTPELIGVNGDKVYMKATYDPHHKTTGKSAGPQADMQEWTVKDGKVTEAKFFWGNEKAMNDIFIA